MVSNKWLMYGALAVGGLYLLSRGGAIDTVTGSPSTSNGGITTPPQTPQTPEWSFGFDINRDIPQLPSWLEPQSFATGLEAYKFFHEERQDLSAWFHAQRHALNPLRAQITALEQRIAYVRAYPGETAGEALAELVPQLEARQLQLQQAMAPIHAAYQERKDILNELQYFFRRLI